MSKLSLRQLTGQEDSHICWLNDRIGIHADVKNAWLAMQAAAKKDGIELEIASGFRSFERQRQIWNNKVTGKTIVKDIKNNPVCLASLCKIAQIKAILLYSALPGASRHHWGTDLDVYAPNLLKENQILQLEPWEYQEKGPFARLSAWLSLHGKSYGFYFPYDSYRGGVAPEPWHISYAALAQQYMGQLTGDQLVQVIEADNIEAGSTLVENIDLILEQYIKNVGDPNNG